MLFYNKTNGSTSYQKDFENMQLIKMIAAKSVKRMPKLNNLKNLLNVTSNKFFNFKYTS